MKIVSAGSMKSGSEIVRSNLLAYEEGRVRAPVHSWVISVPPGHSTIRHNHHDTELWVVISGEGRLDVDGQVVAIARGDVVRLEPTEQHVVHNDASSASLTFVSVWWDDPAALKDEVQGRHARAGGFPADPILLPAFPTPNGDLHLGHLSGPYLGADIYARCAQLHGVRTSTLLGSIGHMNHVAIAARARGQSYYETAEHFTDELLATLRAFRIEHDTFVRPTPTSQYADVLTDVFRRLRQQGLVSRRAELAQHCDHCARFRFEAEVSGRCPFCDSPTASGNDCEGCARHHADHELKDPICRYCGQQTSLREFSRYFFDFQPLHPALKEFVERARMPESLRKFGLWILGEASPPIAISHEADFGVPVPDDPDCNQRISSTFEHAARLIEALRLLSSQTVGASGNAALQQLADGDRSLVVFFGWDNAYMRVILFPALLIAYLGDKVLPEALFTNRFLTLEGSKFSTSRNHAIWGRDMSASAPMDAIRLHLAWVRSEGQERDFQRSAFETFLDETYTGTIGRWRQVLGEIMTRTGGRVPEAGPWAAAAGAFYKEVLAFHGRAGDAASHQGFSPRRLAHECVDFAKLNLDFVIELRELLAQPGKDDRRVHTLVALALMALRSFVLFVRPIMPDFASGMARDLGLDPSLFVGSADLSTPGFLPPGTEVSIAERGSHAVAG